MHSSISPQFSTLMGNCNFSSQRCFTLFTWSWTTRFLWNTLFPIRVNISSIIFSSSTIYVQKRNVKTTSIKWYPVREDEMFPLTVFTHSPALLFLFDDDDVWYFTSIVGACWSFYGIMTCWILLIILFIYTWWQRILCVRILLGIKDTCVWWRVSIHSIMTKIFKIHRYRKENPICPYLINH